MPTATRTFRVFVSSTFEDLKAARDALQREAFPKLRKLREQRALSGHLPRRLTTMPELERVRNSIPPAE